MTHYRIRAKVRSYSRGEMVYVVERWRWLPLGWDDIGPDLHSADEARDWLNNVLEITKRMDTQAGVVERIKV